MKSKHSVTYRWDILQLKLKWSLDLDFKNTLTTLLESDLFYNVLGLAMKNIRITLLDLDRFYDVLDLDLKQTRTTLLDLVWFY